MILEYTQRPSKADHDAKADHDYIITRVEEDRCCGRLPEGRGNAFTKTCPRNIRESVFFLPAFVGPCFVSTVCRKQASRNIRVRTKKGHLTPGPYNTQNCVVTPVSIASVADILKNA